VHAVYPRARVRLSAVAVALSLSSSFALTLTTTSAHAEASSSALTSNDAVKNPAPPALSAATLLAPKAVTVAATKHASATKPVQISSHELAHDKAVVQKAAHRSAVHRAAVHKAAVAKAAATRRAAFGTRVIRAAAQYRGTPYRYGATGPSRFDCSGFTRFIFAKFGISLPHSSSGQYSVVRHIANSNKRIGDLVFFHSSGGHVYHVGIYAGGDEIWAATHTGDFVRLEGMWNASYYVGRIT
jgi:cell wall-associated NlpC family hydrolase